jgi:hypothetical protein
MTTDYILRGVKEGQTVLEIQTGTWLIGNQLDRDQEISEVDALGLIESLIDQLDEDWIWPEGADALVVRSSDKAVWEYDGDRWVKRAPEAPVPSTALPTQRPDETKAFADQFGERGLWNVHPTYCLEDWQYEVANDDTRLGYWDWVMSYVDQEGDRDQDDQSSA